MSGEGTCVCNSGSQTQALASPRCLRDSETAEWNVRPGATSSRQGRACWAGAPAGGGGGRGGSAHSACGCSASLWAAGKVSIRMEGKDTEHTCPVGPPLRVFERPEKGPCAQPAEPPGALGVGQRMPLPACPSGRNKGAARLCVGAEGRGSGAPVWGGLWQKPPVFYYCCFQKTRF